MTTDNAKDNAQARLDNIIDLTIRYGHALICDGYVGEMEIRPRCQITDQRIAKTLDISPVTADDRESYHNPEEALERIEGSLLDIGVRSGWSSLSDKPDSTLEPAEYLITIPTGGPACRIRGGLDHNGVPDTLSRIEYQDWGTPWTELPISSTERTRLMEYAEALLATDWPF